MAKYLITSRETVGTRYEATVRAIVKATDHGWAKSHWHRQQNRIGGTKDGKHEYMFDSLGYRSELLSVRELDPEEDAALIQEIDSIPGFDKL